MNHWLFRAVLSVALVALLMSTVLPAWGQEVGTVSAVESQAEIGDGTTFSPATVGAAVALGNVLRTGNPGRLQVVFQDDSVLTLVADSRVTVDEHVFAPATGNVRSLLKLLQGRVTAVVSDYYHQAGASYEIKTATAVAGVRGTEFSVRYDPQQEITEVVGISGVVSVHSAVDPTGPGILITASEVTTVAPGQLPSEPRKLEDTTFRQQLEGVVFVGGGRLESISGGHPLATGSSVPATDGAAALGGGGVAGAEGPPRPIGLGSPDASSLLGQSPAGVVARTGQIDIDFGRHH